MLANRIGKVLECGNFSIYWRTVEKVSGVIIV